jgi:hypothetical protein
MTPPSEEDRIASSGQKVSERWEEGWWAVSEEDVRDNMESTGYPMDKIMFIKGKVEETLDSGLPERISILRLDTDWYESTRKELKVLYPLLSPGGILIIDDYGHFTGARKAVDEFLASEPGPLFPARTDYTGRIMMKP